jgi:hypothetical protein
MDTTYEIRLRCYRYNSGDGGGRSVETVYCASESEAHAEFDKLKKIVEPRLYSLDEQPGGEYLEEHFGFHGFIESVLGLFKVETTITKLA